MVFIFLLDVRLKHNQTMYKNVSVCNSDIFIPVKTGFWYIEKLKKTQKTQRHLDFLVNGDYFPFGCNIEL